MQWIILLGDKDFDFEAIKNIKYHECLESYEVKGGIFPSYYVEFEDEYIFYDYYGNDYDNDEFEKDLKIVPFCHPKVTLMKYRSKSLVKRILLQSDFPRNLYVDNDFGLIVPLKKFISLGMPLDREDMERANIPVILE